VATDGYEGLERFADVDSTGEEAMFVSFLERIEQLPDVVARRHRSYELLDNGDGELVADVGCGLGTAVRELAARGTRAIGFDSSAAMIAEARRRFDGAEVEYAHADAVDLPLEDGRSYRRLLAEAGFADVTVHAEVTPITAPPLAEIVPKVAADAAVAAGAVDPGDAALWLADQRARLEEGTFFAAMTHFVAVAHRRSPS
jgi:SAM-dependent methyltransferase